MKILIGSLTYPLLNGVTTSIDLSVDGLVAAGHEVRIISPSYGTGQARPEHRPVSTAWLSRIFLHLANKKERMFSYRAPAEIMEVATDLQPDIFWLHTLSWSANAFEKVMFSSGKPTVLTYHTLVEDYGRLYAGWLGGRMMRTRSRYVASRVDRVIAPSHVIAKRLIGYGSRSPITVIPTGIGLPERGYTKAELASRFHFLPDDLLLLYVGRISKEKNIPTLLQAVREVNQSRPAILLMIGPGDIEETRKKADEMGIANRIICSGPLAKEDTQKIYHGADMFIFASQTETQGLVIGEAMLAGTPVVAVRSPIQPEIYPEGTAQIVSKNEHLGRAIIKLSGDKNAQREFAKSAKRFVVQNFSVESMTKHQIEVFRQLL